MLRIKLIKSTVGHNWRNRRTVEALGLRKIRQTKLHEDTPTIRGMIRHVRDLLEVEVVSDAEAAAKPAKAKATVVTPPEPVSEPKPKATKKKAEDEPEAEKKPRAKKKTETADSGE